MEIMVPTWCCSRCDCLPQWPCWSEVVDVMKNKNCPPLFTITCKINCWTKGSNAHHWISFASKVMSQLTTENTCTALDICFTHFNSLQFTKLYTKWFTFTVRYLVRVFVTKKSTDDFFSARYDELWANDLPSVYTKSAGRLNVECEESHANCPPLRKKSVAERKVAVPITESPSSAIDVPLITQIRHDTRRYRTRF